MYKALYRECRPETFEEVLGQEHIVKILKNQLATDAVSHAYLFCGTRGTGKTTMARLLAKGVNCLNPREDGGPCGECEHCNAIKNGTFMDVVEIDAASNNGVDNIRELRESVKYPPAAGRKKVYIIDEVHMLSSGAFNALLKTLEEPPESVMFILATTEPQKLLATILSRCMRLDFKRVTEKTLGEGFARICERKGIEIDDAAIRLIASNADGSVRDGLSILDQCLATGQKHITRDDVLDFLGTTGEDVFIELTDLVKLGKTSEALLLINRILADGKDVRQFMKDWMTHYRNLMVSKFLKSAEDVLNMSTENLERLRAQGEKLDLSEINNAIIELSHTMADARWSTQPRILLELCTVKLSTGNMFMRPVPQAQPAAPAVQVPVQAPGPAVQAPQAEEPAPPVAQPTAPAPQAAPVASDSFDLDELWLRVFEEGESDRPSFNLMRTATTLKAMDDNKFYVAADTKFTGKYVNENRDILENLMARFTGKHRRLQCIVQVSGEQETARPNPDNMKAGLESLIGVPVEMK